MATFANLSISDSVPTSRTFTAMENSGGTSVWTYIPSGMASLGGRSIKLRITRGKTPQDRYKVEIKISVPLVDAPATAAGAYTPAPKVVETTELTMIFFMSNRASQLDRDDLVAFAANLLAVSGVKDAISKGIGITG